jgi:DNA-binding MarR family transcriptional regulator
MVDSEANRLRSKHLFGHSYMLEVCASMPSAGQRTKLSDLADAVDVSLSLCSAPVKRLVALGLLVEDRRPADDHRERWYVVTPSKLWPAAKELRA